MKPKPIAPQRLRRIPPHFSWIDHRLVRQGYLQRCPHAALSLYLFYLTVADAQGLSYYADPGVMTRLSMTQIQLDDARQCLISQGLIAYRQPLVQVLSLDEPVVTQGLPKTGAPGPIHAIPSAARPENTNALIQELKAQLRKSQ